MQINRSVIVGVYWKKEKGVSKVRDITAHLYVQKNQPEENEIAE